MSDLLETTRHAIAKYSLLTPGDTVVVAVSGGADSVALLDVLWQLAHSLDVTLHVAHLDHGLRETSATDAQFVTELAQHLGVDYTVGQADVGTLAQRDGLSLEEAARQARYQFLSDVAHAVGATRVATAHHANDQTETVLLHLLRGTGLAGLRGMLPSAPLPIFQGKPSEVSITLIRPWLNVSRDTILVYVAERGLDYREDPTNQDTRLARNRVRHELLPLLATYNPGIIDTLGRMARTLADDHAALEDLVAAAWPSVAREMSTALELRLAPLASQPPAIRRRLVRQAIARLGSLRDITTEHIEATLRLADSQTGERLDLPGGLSVTRGSTSLTLGHGQPPLPDWPLLLPGATMPVAVPGIMALPESGWALRVEYGPNPPAPFPTRDGGARVQSGPPPFIGEGMGERFLWSATIDAAAATGGLWLRTRWPGERFQPLGLEGHHQTLHDFMNSAKIPREARDRLPLLVNADGVVWVCGFRLDHRARVNAETRKTLHLSFTQI